MSTSNTMIYHSKETKVTGKGEVDVVTDDTSYALLTADIQDDTLRQWLEQIANAGDTRTVTKAVEIIEKWEQQTLHIGFCGLFSAGKSTLINALLEAPLLPSSPIPTSANVVRICSGEPKAEIVLKSGSVREVPQDEMERWKDYCRNGDEVDRVLIRHDHPLLADGVELMDTPGIDSTDERHQEATQAALHMADCVLFVADYHHVQSEHNFAFLKKLQEQGKTIILIINQMDKHNTGELSITAFMERVKDGLAEWGIDLPGLFCTSLKHVQALTRQHESQNGQDDNARGMLCADGGPNPSPDEYQLSSLRTLMLRLRDHKRALIGRHVRYGLQHLVEEHGDFLRERQEYGRATLQDQLEQLQSELRSELGEEGDSDRIVRLFTESMSAPEQWQDDVGQEVRKIVRNAQITPHDTTQLALSCIESYQPGFKIGFWRARAKTEAERKHRLQALYDDLVPRIRSEIEWHIRQMLSKKAEQYHVQGTDVLEKLVNWELTFPQAWLTDRMQTNVDPRQYVYTYTEELAGRVQQLYIRQTEALADEVTDALREKHRERYAGREQLVEKLQTIITVQQERQQLENYVQEQTEQLAERINAWKHRPALQLTVEEHAWQKCLLEVMQQTPVIDKPEMNDNIGTIDKTGTDSDLGTAKEAGITNEASFNSAASESQTVDVSSRTTTAGSSFHRLAERLHGAADILEKIPSLANEAQSMRRKAERMKKQRFRISLFGAFSAGKSSFANVLLGKELLPVSPNPTTAAITYIVQATEKNPPQTARIRMKNRERILSEINLCLERLQMKPIAEADVSKDPSANPSAYDKQVRTRLSQVRHIRPERLGSSLKPYYAFLHAVYVGWEDTCQKLGEIIVADEAEYRSFVAEERKACFVEDVRVYLDTPFTNQGFEVVDTPGADSIYARHTDVTFNFLKSSDIVLYLTYYNHAFSMADRQFLEQLGRVKDQFMLDHTFFVVNAADLAQSREELSQVESHVQHNLERTGIRSPRLFSVSSLKALQGEDGSGFDTFFEAFHTFVQNELVCLAQHAVHGDLERGYRLMQEMFEDVQNHAPARREKASELAEKQRNWKRRIEDTDYPEYTSEIERETEELVHYVQLRMKHSLSEHVQHAFNPTALSRGNSGRKQLRLCLDDWLAAMETQWRDEALSTTLRLEKYVERLQQRVVEEWNREAAQDGIRLSGYTVEKVDWEQFPPIRPTFSLRTDQWYEELVRTLKHFKNPKHFFEQDGRKQMIAAMEECVYNWLEQAGEEMIGQYRERFNRGWQQAQEYVSNGLQEEINTAVEARLSVLTGELSTAELEPLLDQFTALQH